MTRPVSFADESHLQLSLRTVAADELECPGALGHVIRVDELGERPADEIEAVVVDDAFERRIDTCQPPLDVEQGETRRQPFEDRLEGRRILGRRLRRLGF